MRKIIKQECPNCGKIFVQKADKPGNKFKYCCDRCRIDYWIRQDHLKRKAAHKENPEKICPNCSKKIYEEFGCKRKYCSERCKKQYYSRISNNGAVYREVDPTCPNCARKFEKPKTGYQRFCCAKCRINYWSKHCRMVLDGVTSQIVCKNCKKKFESYGKNLRNFCGEMCQEKYFESKKERLVCPVCTKIFGRVSK